MKLNTCENILINYEQIKNKNKLMKYIEDNDFLNLFDSEDYYLRTDSKQLNKYIDTIDNIYINLEEYLNICNFTIENYDASTDYTGIHRETIKEITEHKEKIEKYLLKLKIENEFKRIEKEGQLGKFIRENGYYNESYQNCQYIYKNVFFSLDNDGDLFIKEDSKHMSFIPVDKNLNIKINIHFTNFDAKYLIDNAKELLNSIQLNNSLNNELEIKKTYQGRTKI